MNVFMMYIAGFMCLAVPLRAVFKNLHAADFWSATLLFTGLFIAPLWAACVIFTLAAGM